MIYPVISVKEWITIFPVLEIKKGKCPSCNTKLETTRPFMEKYWVGLEAPTCTCGRLSPFATMAPHNGRYVNLFDSLIGTYENDNITQTIYRKLRIVHEETSFS